MITITYVLIDRDGWQVRAWDEQEASIEHVRRTFNRAHYKQVTHKIYAGQWIREDDYKTGAKPRELRTVAFIHEDFFGHLCPFGVSDYDRDFLAGAGITKEAEYHG